MRVQGGSRMLVEMTEWEVSRKEPRYRLRIPVILRLGKESVELMTEDVSFSGMFVRTDAPPPERGLIKIDVPVPGEVVSLAMTAMVVHCIEPALPSQPARVPGAGLQLYGVGADLREKWSRYVLSLRDKDANAASRPVLVETGVNEPEMPNREPIGRRHIRYAAVLIVRAKTIDDLVTTYTRDISQGGTFLTTDVAVSAGEALCLELIHPDTGEAFDLDCVVRRRVRDGLGVEFTDLDDDKREAFWQFVEPVIELAEEDFVLLD